MHGTTFEKKIVIFVILTYFLKVKWKVNISETVRAGADMRGTASIVFLYLPSNDNIANKVLHDLDPLFERKKFCNGNGNTVTEFISATVRTSAKMNIDNFANFDISGQLIAPLQKLYPTFSRSSILNVNMSYSERAQKKVKLL